MNGVQGKPTISPGTVLFLWTFLAVTSCAIAVHSILSGSNETLASLLNWDRMPKLVESRFTQASDSEQLASTNTPSNLDVALTSRVTQLDEKLESVAHSINTLQQDNTRIQEARASTSSRIERLETTFDSITGSLPPGNVVNSDNETTDPDSFSSGSVSVNILPFPIDAENDTVESQIMPGSVQSTEFAVIIARSTERASLSRIWNMMREEQGRRFDGLMPRVLIEADAVNGVQHALVAGPLRNAQTAIELCTHLALPSSSCQPIRYGGEMLPEMAATLQRE